MTAFELRWTDRLFLDHVEDGEPECLCSRCGLVIEERCAPAIRCWRESEPDFEYRFHPHCLGMSPCCENDRDEDDFDPDAANDFARENPREEC